MTEMPDRIEAFLAESTLDEQRALKRILAARFPHPLEGDWGIESETILTAIRRSSDLTKRGVRGIIAEAVFETTVVPQAESFGWNAEVLAGDLPYYVRLRKDDKAARIQIKLQRLEKGIPKLFYPRHYDRGILYVVEVQKTRTGKRATDRPLGLDSSGAKLDNLAAEQTRPYRFDDFDILAVNLQPSTKDWTSFRYTLSSWLLPRVANKNLIEIFQPVALVPNAQWTDSLATCLGWFEAGEKGSVLDEIRHRRNR